MSNRNLLVTGGAGFIRSAVIRHIINTIKHSVVNIDKLTYTGNLESLASIGNNELQNIEVDKTVRNIFLELAPSKLDGVDRYEQLISFVCVRAGHDLGYAIDATKIENEPSWTSNETLATGIRKTVGWYLGNTIWWDRFRDESYQGESLGVISR